MVNPSSQRYHRHCLCRDDLPIYPCIGMTCQGCPHLKEFDEEFLMFAITLNERVPSDTTIFKKLF